MFKAHGLLHHSTLGLRVIRVIKKKKSWGGEPWCRARNETPPPPGSRIDPPSREDRGREQRPEREQELLSVVAPTQWFVCVTLFRSSQQLSSSLRRTIDHSTARPPPR